MDDDAGLVAVLCEAAHLGGGDALFDSGEGVVIAALVADEEEAKAVVLETFDGVVVEVRAAVAGPIHAERAELLRDFAGAREVRGEGVVIEEELAHLREELLHVSHLVGDVLRAADAILVPADGLRPEAEGALGRAAAARIHRDVGMLEVADEILFDLEVALVNVGDPRERVHVGNHLALGVVLNLPFAVLVGNALHGREVAAFGDFLAGEVELLARDPVNGPRGLERLGGQHHRVRADEANLGGGPLLLDGLGDLAVVLQRGRGGVDDDVVEVLRDGEALGHVNVVRRAVEEPAAGHERGGLREPGGIPVAGDFARGLVAGTGAAVKAVEGGRGEEECAHDLKMFSV